jgi:hypothetical protein
MENNDDDLVSSRTETLQKLNALEGGEESIYLVGEVIGEEVARQIAREIQCVLGEVASKPMRNICIMQLSRLEEEVDTDIEDDIWKIVSSRLDKEYKIQLNYAVIKTAYLSAKDFLLQSFENTQSEFERSQWTKLCEIPCTEPEGWVMVEGEGEKEEAAGSNPFFLPRET